MKINPFTFHFRNQSTHSAKRVRLFPSLLLAIPLILFIACDPHPGFEKIETGIYQRLDKFGDCKPPLASADFFIMEVSYKKINSKDTGYHFILHHHALDQNPTEGQPIGHAIATQLKKMNCGDKITWILPFAEINNSFLSAYADTSIYALSDEMELSLDLQKTFNQKEYCNYLMSMAQHQELPEPDAIELYLRNTPTIPFEKHGDCYMQITKKNNGDSIRVGRTVSLQWNTFLFNGEPLDDTTEMVFTFGKPGQLINGFQYGLSFLGQGDEATIYLPSYLAFGENGSSSGIVPPRTPVYFKVKVLDVVTEQESESAIATLKTNRSQHGKRTRH